MFCSRCGKPAQSGAAFCMHCGQTLAPQAGQAQPGSTPIMNRPAPAFPVSTKPNAKKNAWIAAGAALAIVLALFFGLSAAGLLKFGSKEPDLEPLKAQGQQPTIPLLRAEGTQAPADVKAHQIQMPDDVRRWLEHLERIEKRKNELSLRQLTQMAVLAQQMKVLGGAMSLLNGDDEDAAPSDTAKQHFDELRPEWNQLISDFRSLPPPAECRPIADEFNRAVSEIPGINADLAAILSGAAADPATSLESVMKLQNTSANVIDKNLASSDARIADLCRKYDTRKWFDIKTDVGGGLMGKFGL